MKRIFTLIICTLVAIAGFAQAKTKINNPSLSVDKGTIRLTMEIQLSDEAMNRPGTCTFIPVLTDGKNQQAFQMKAVNKSGNGNMSKRDAMIAKRKGETVLPETQKVVYYDETADYKPWMAGARLDVVCEIKDGNTILQREVVNVNVNTQSLATERSVSVNNNSSGMIGSYLVPELDMIDERNKSELDFSLEEARVIAELNPEMLSLRELYEVARSYINNRDRFRKILDVSVLVYPSSVVANLNAASCALEMNDIEAAREYLKRVQSDSPEYKNVRGVFEVLTGNTNEGVRLLKAAKKEGVAEADMNLKTFFSRYEKIYK